MPTCPTCMRSTDEDPDAVARPHATFHAACWALLEARRGQMPLPVPRKKRVGGAASGSEGARDPGRIAGQMMHGNVRWRQQKPGGA